MPQYRTCGYCGSNLDAGERCDCRESQPHPPEKPAINACRVQSISLPFDGIFEKLKEVEASGSIHPI